MAEEILDVLRAQGSISEAQYRDWTARAQEEAAAWAKASAGDGADRPVLMAGAAVGATAAASSAPAAPPAAPTASAGDEASEAGGDERPLVAWKDGLRLYPRDDIEMRIFGRVYADYTWVDSDDDTVEFFDNEDLDGGSGTQFSRARIGIGATFDDFAEFKAEWDFGEGDAEAKDVYLELHKLPFIGNVRAGHFKEPYTLQRLVSSRHILFLERSLMNTFSTNRNMGVQVGNSFLDGRMTWTLGGFLEVDDKGFDFSDGGNHHLTARLTGLVFDRDEGRKLLHLGFGYLHRFVGDSVRFESRPEADLTPVNFVDTGDFPASHVDQITPELSLVWGPFALQTEYTLALVDSSATGNPTFDGFYVEASWFLTGEHRPYIKKRAIFGQVQPRRNLDLKGGFGAWQLAFRYSWVDLADGAFREVGTDPPQGRRLDDFTVGLNWYLNPYMRLMFNYIRADLEDVGQSNIIESRVQFDW